LGDDEALVVVVVAVVEAAPSVCAPPPADATAARNDAAAESVDALKASAAEIKALGLTGEAQATASAAYRARLDALKAAA
jgi:hypothetical protein